jgi:hypothetical protein
MSRKIISSIFVIASFFHNISCSSHEKQNFQLHYKQDKQAALVATINEYRKINNINNNTSIVISEVCTSLHDGWCHLKIQDNEHGPLFINMRDHESENHGHGYAIH